MTENTRDGFIKTAAEKARKMFSTGFFHIFGGSAINKMISFLSSIILVRILSKTEYGVYAYAANIYSLVLILNGMGIESGFIQLAGEHGSNSDFIRKFGNYGSRFGLVFNFGLTVILLIIGLFIPLKIPAAGKLICAFSLLPLLQIIYNMILCFLRAEKRNQEYAKLSVINTVLVLAASVGCAIAFREMGLIFGQYIAIIISCIIGFGAFKVRLTVREKTDLGSEKKDLLRISFISMVINALSQLLYLLDLFVIGIVDPQETIIASYKVATVIPTALIFIPNSLVIYIYPYFAEHKDDTAWCLKHYKQIILGLGAFNLFVSVMLFALAPFIVKIIFGEQYLDAVPVFRILAVNYFISGTFRTIAGNLLVAQRKLKFNLYESIISSVINIVADYFLIQLWGSIGAAIATVIVVLVSSSMGTVYLVQTYRSKLHQVYESD